MRRWISAFVAGAGLLTSLVVTSAPADAAPPIYCGAWKTVLTSINYRACDQQYTTGIVWGYNDYQNNHGSAVHNITYQWGISVNGGSVQWQGGKQVDIAAGYSRVLSAAPHCTSGQSIRYVLRLYDTHTGAWGPGSFATPVTCP